MKIFAELGTTVERRWRERNFEETIFPEIASDALDEANLPAQISAWDVAEWALRETNLPVQRDLSAGFGEPPITIFNSARFHIDLYFWLTATTAIHQHSFCGAFQVLHGGSLQSLYNFTERERINFHCAVGEMRLYSVERLKTGDIKQILGGDKFVHSLFHLENPSATIVVRTTHLPLNLPQFSYYKPSLAIDPFFDEQTFIRQRQIVGMLLKSKASNADALIAELLAKADFHASVEFLRFLKNNLTADKNSLRARNEVRQNRFEKFLAIVQEKHGNLAEGLPAVFAEIERQREIIERRSSVTDANHRYFLALLLNVPGKNRVLPLVAEHAPERDPVETVLDWFDELGRTRIAETNENALGIEDYNDDYAFVLEGMLKGKTAAEIETGIRAEFPAGYADELAGKVSRYHETLKNSRLFSSLW